NDTDCVQAAISAQAGKTLVIDRMYCIGNTLTMPTVSSMTIVGSGGAWPHPGKTGFNACAVNLNPMVMVGGGGSQIRGLYIDAGAAGPNTSGITFETLSTGNNANDVRFEDIYVKNPCIAFEEDGNSNLYDHVRSEGQAATGCPLMRIGHFTTNTGTVDPRIVSSVFTASSPNNPLAKDACLRIEDVGGAYLLNTDILYCYYGTAITPGTNQWVTWMYFNNMALADTTVSDGLIIAPKADSSRVVGNNFIGTWTSSSQRGNGVTVTAPAGVVDGNYFIGHRALGNAGDGFSVGGPGVTNIAIDNSSICGNSESQPNAHNGISLLPNSTGNFYVRNNTVSATCDNVGGHHQQGYGMWSNTPRSPTTG